MELKVSANNEYRFIPDIGDNKKLPGDQRFCVVLKRMNITLNATRWIKYGNDGSMTPDIVQKLRDHIIRLENPPVLRDGEKKIDLTVDILLSDKYSELDDLLAMIIDEINQMQPKRLNVETKKS